jgi:hypothetical protein
VPKDTVRFYGNGGLKIYCFGSQIRLYADETFKIRQMGNAVPSPEKGFSGKRISLLNEDRVMQLMRPYIET